jgi:dolichol-phosphate mannosyltransferase
MLRLSIDVVQASFAAAQTIAVVTAIAFNFTLNNAFTYRDRKLTGVRWFIGLLSFYVVCGFGAIANVGVGVLVFSNNPRWWLAGIAGAVVGSIWNFAASSFVTWRKR